ncbi:MAG: hypothetical protein ACK4NP_08835 [Parvularculaceae bacterium]
MRPASIVRRSIAIATAFLLTGPPVRAETVILSPDPCPAAAEQPLIIDLGDVELFNRDPEVALGRILVVYPPLREGWASARILMRFDLEPQAAGAGEPGCSRPRPFTAPN